MKALDVFLKGVNTGAVLRIDWVRSLFCIVNEKEGTWKQEPYPYRIVQQRDGIYYVTEDTQELAKITDVSMTEPLLKPEMVVSLTKGSLANVREDIKTTVGNVIINAVAIIYPFDNKIPFMAGKVSVGDIEKIILARLKDIPKDGRRSDDFIYMDEYLEFKKAMTYVRGMSDIFIPTASEKLMTPPPNIKELRNKLIEENKDRLNDAAVLAKIDDELLKADDAYLNDDDDAKGFLFKGKFRNEVRRKRFLTVGAQTGFKDSVEVDHVAKSLTEGISVEDIPVLNSGSRVGSFNRGAETMNGGAQFKRLIRAASNARIADEDCGTKIGRTTLITKENQKEYIGYYAIVNGASIELTEDNIKQYLDKPVMVRSVMYCKSEKNDYCKKCAGPKLSLHPTAVAVAVSDIGSTFLTLFLKKMHVSGLSTARMNIKDVLS